MRGQHHFEAPKHRLVVYKTHPSCSLMKSLDLEGSYSIIFATRWPWNDRSAKRTRSEPHVELRAFVRPTPHGIKRRELVCVLVSTPAILARRMARRSSGDSSSSPRSFNSRHPHEEDGAALVTTLLRRGASFNSRHPHEEDGALSCSTIKHMRSRTPRFANLLVHTLAGIMLSHRKLRLSPECWARHRIANPPGFSCAMQVRAQHHMLRR